MPPKHKQKQPTLLAQLIGKRLRSARVCAGMPAKQVAERLNYQNATQVSLAEKGERVPHSQCLSNTLGFMQYL